MARIDRLYASTFLTSDTSLQMSTMCHDRAGQVFLAFWVSGNSRYPDEGRTSDERTGTLGQPRPSPYPDAG